jgi:hypothetical protein
VSEPGHFAIFAPSIYQYGKRKMVTRLVAVGNGQVGRDQAICTRDVLLPAAFPMQRLRRLHWPSVLCCDPIFGPGTGWTPDRTEWRKGRRIDEFPELAGGDSQDSFSR